VCFVSGFRCACFAHSSCAWGWPESASWLCFRVEVTWDTLICAIAGVLSQSHGGGPEVLRDQPQGMRVGEALVWWSGRLSCILRAVFRGSGAAASYDASEVEVAMLCLSRCRASIKCTICVRSGCTMRRFSGERWVTTSKCSAVTSTGKGSGWLDSAVYVYRLVGAGHEAVCVAVRI
jgi:hypothetical protein